MTTLAETTIPVAVHGLSGGSIGIIVSIVLSFLSTVALAYFKVWPKLLEIGLAGKKSERDAAADARNDQIEDLLSRVARLEAQVEEATKHAIDADERTNVMKYKMVSLNAAFQLVAGEMRRVDPENAILKQALDLIAMAATEDMGIGRAMVEISKLPATRRGVMRPS